MNLDSNYFSQKYNAIDENVISTVFNQNDIYNLILAIHIYLNWFYDEYDVKYVTDLYIRDINSLKELSNRYQTIFNEDISFEQLVLIVATIANDIFAKQIFYDGNGRTAFTAIKVILMKMGYQFTYEDTPNRSLKDNFDIQYDLNDPDLSKLITLITENSILSPKDNIK